MLALKDSKVSFYLLVPNTSNFKGLLHVSHVENWLGEREIRLLNILLLVIPTDFETPYIREILGQPHWRKTDVI